MLAMLGATLAMIGPGARSVDARLFGRKHFEIPAGSISTGTHERYSKTGLAFHEFLRATNAQKDRTYSSGDNESVGAIPLAW